MSVPEEDRLDAELGRACRTLGLHVELRPRLMLPSGRRFLPRAWIEHLGGKNGMVILTSYEEKVCAELADAGYGFSVLSEQRITPFDLDTFMEMFSEWTWTGDARDKPEWMA